jgi:hypothetical protein
MQENTLYDKKLCWVTDTSKLDIFLIFLVPLVAT